MELIKKKEEEMNVFSVTYDNIDLLDSHALAIRFYIHREKYQ